MRYPIREALLEGEPMVRIPRWMVINSYPLLVLHGTLKQRCAMLKSSLRKNDHSEESRNAP